LVTRHLGRVPINNHHDDLISTSIQIFEAKVL
jgi:hypothetical protein